MKVLLLKSDYKIGTFHSQFRIRQWPCLSDYSKDLVSRMLTVNPDQRITVEEALQHPWIAVCTNNILCIVLPAYLVPAYLVPSYLVNHVSRHFSNPHSPFKFTSLNSDISTPG